MRLLSLYALLYLLSFASAANAAETERDEESVTLQMNAKYACVLSNDTASTITVYGYPNQKGGGSPFFSCEVYIDKVWKPMQLGWCGTGAGPIVVHAGDKLEFTIHPANGKSFDTKACINYTDNQKKRHAVISNAIQGTAKEQPRAITKIK
ncbi:MAG: hypothetical protein HRU15_10915 [Planctomycetes bacterium]|nr:hypothetical protein [Planctomycetota bacterium]